MIKQVKMWTIECDNCHTTSGENSEFSCWNEDAVALEDALEAGWIEYYNKHYCPKCYVIDEEDEITLINKSNGN